MVFTIVNTIFLTVLILLMFPFMLLGVWLRLVYIGFKMGMSIYDESLMELYNKCEGFFR